MNDLRNPQIKCRHKRPQPGLIWLWAFFLIWSSAFAAGRADAQGPDAFSGATDDLQERRRAVAKFMEAATVWIVIYGREDVVTGSGFIVGEGLAVTNGHVVNALANGDIYVLNKHLPPVKAKILAQVDEIGLIGFSGHDFALLRFSPPQGVKLPALTLNLEVRRMDLVNAWGYPGVLTKHDDSYVRLLEGDASQLQPAPVVVTEGAVNTLIKQEPSITIIHSAVISKGNSGGPLVNGRGEVVGMNTWVYHDQNVDVKMAQSAADLAEFMAKHGVQPQLAANQQLNRAPRRYQPPPVADAKSRNVGSFTVKVPAGWSITDSDENAVFLSSDLDFSLISIIVGKNQGLSVKEIAQIYYDHFEGSKFEDNNDGLYVFNFKADDSSNKTDSQALFAQAKRDSYLMVVITGDVSKNDLNYILQNTKGN
ncbi:MAG: serine protease [Deltaproteobacteria bacterium]|nr:serine protease [Deltaproteobacteria bacterium]